MLTLQHCRHVSFERPANPINAQHQQPFRKPVVEQLLRALTAEKVDVAMAGIASRARLFDELWSRNIGGADWRIEQRGTEGPVCTGLTKLGCVEVSDMLTGRTAELLGALPVKDGDPLLSVWT